MDSNHWWGDGAFERCGAVEKRWCADESTGAGWSTSSSGGTGLKKVTGVDIAGGFEEGTVAEAAIFSCGLTAADEVPGPKQ